MSHYRVSWNFRADDMVAHGHLGEIDKLAIETICYTSIAYADSDIRSATISAATLITALQTEARAEKPRVSMLRKLVAKINQHPDVIEIGGRVKIYEPLVLDPSAVHDVLQSYPAREENA